VQQHLDYCQRALAGPRAPLRAQAARLHALSLRAGHAMSRQVAALHRRRDDQAARLQRMAPRVDFADARMQRRTSALAAGALHLLHARQGRLQTLAARLQALDPHAVLARGYALATDARGRVVTDAARLAAGDLLRLRFAHGGALARVEHADAGDEPGSTRRDAD
jgi:exodeoxyribonuclease VII large subunit